MTFVIFTAFSSSSFRCRLGGGVFVTSADFTGASQGALRGEEGNYGSHQRKSGR